MTPLGLFRRKEPKTTEKQEEKPKTTPPKEKSLLAELCGNNKELHEILSRTLLLNPEVTVKEGIDLHLEKAQQFENDQRPTNARVEYQLAGQIALFEGKLQQMQKLFKKAAEAEPDYEFRKIYDYFAKKENAEQAIEVAREFYAKASKRT
jgi:hypothetical protein